LLLLPAGVGPAAIESARFTATANQRPKTLGNVRLGMPRGY
jgi:hypothetical protein